MTEEQLSASTSSSRRLLRVALVGNPNTGKTTLFNALVGLRQRVGNFPGVTVEKKSGQFSQGPWTVEVVDLPGLVSLAVTSADELITFEVLCGLRADTPPPDVVVLVVDASHLERQLYLVGQVLELGLPAILVVNMMDVAQKEGKQLRLDELGRRLGIPVIAAVAHRRQGVAELREMLKSLAKGEKLPPGIDRSVLPPVIDNEVARLESTLGELIFEVFRPGSAAAKKRQRVSPRDTQHIPLGSGEVAGATFGPGDAFKHKEVAAALGEVSAGGWLDNSVRQNFARFLLRRCLLDPPGGLITEVLLPELDRQVTAEVFAARARLSAAGIDLATVEPDFRFAWVRELIRDVVAQAPVPTVSWSERIDQVLTHPWWGVLFLLVAMLVTFQAVYILSNPLVDLLQVGLGWCSGQLSHALPPGIFREFVIGGLLSGVGTVLSFVPPIAVLFFFIGVLEDCGYLTRSAFVMDRWLAPVGLSGKCFIPLLTCFSCAVPGVMATRVIDDPGDRLRAILVAPLMTCSARLPVFTLMSALLVPADAALLGGWIKLQGIALASMYLLGIAAAGLSAWAFSRTIIPGGGGLFILELPHYKWPDISTVLFRVLERLKLFLKLAGTIILGVSVIMWILTNFPRNEHLITNDAEVQRLTQLVERVASDSPEWEDLVQELELARLAAIQRHSLLGRLGRAIEPIFWPAGWDWRLGCAVLASFPAREVVVANLGVLFQLADVGTDIPEGYLHRIRDKLLQVRWEGSDRRLFSWPAALSVMVFFSLCVQCASTLVIIGRETYSWRWPVFVFVYLTLLAYLGAVVTYQVASALDTWWHYAKI